MFKETEVESWSIFAETLLSIGQRLVNELTLSEDNPSRSAILTVLLVCRTLGNLNGVLVLIKAGMLVEARTIARCCFENLFFVEALRHEGEKFVDEMFEDEIAISKRTGEFFLENRKRLPYPEYEQRLRLFLRRIKNQKSRKSSFEVKSIALRGSVGNFYTFYAELSANAAHPTGKALSRHLIERDGASVRGADVQPAVAKEALSDALRLASCATLALFQILGSETSLSEQISDALTQYKSAKS